MSDNVEEVKKKKTIILNERELTEEEFELEKNKVNVQIVEVSPGVYKTRLFD